MNIAAAQMLYGRDLMAVHKAPVRLLEEWARTVDDYFKACSELHELAASGSREEFEKAQREVRELKLLVAKARHRYTSALSRPRAHETHPELDVNWTSDRNGRTINGTGAPRDDRPNLRYKRRTRITPGRGM
jgi:succinate dehydrogenase/fumarate reductase flavoprotein subunit